MKSKINFKILYLVLALYYLLPFTNFTSFFFQPYDETGLEQSTTYIAHLLIYLLLLFVLGFLYFKTKSALYSLSTLTLIKLTLLFMWFSLQFIWPFISGQFKYLLILITYLVPLFFKEKPRNLEEIQLQIPNEERLNQVRTTYEALFNTALAALIIVSGIEILIYVIDALISPSTQYSLSAVITLKCVVILITLLIYIGHEKFKKYFVSKIQSSNQVVFAYTFFCFIVYFYINPNQIFFFNFEGLYSFYNLVVISIVLAGLLFLYFRKGNQILKQGASITHIAFSSLIYCMAGGFIFFSLYHILPEKILSFIKVYRFSSEQNVTIHLSLGILLFLFNQKLSRFLSSRSL